VGVGATSGFVFFAFRKWAVDVGTGSAEIDTRAFRLGRALLEVMVVGAAETWFLLFGRMNWRTGVGISELLDGASGVEGLSLFPSSVGRTPSSTVSSMIMSRSCSSNGSIKFGSRSVPASAPGITAILPWISFSGTFTAGSSMSMSRSPSESFSGNEILSFSRSKDDSSKCTLKHS